MTIPVKVNLLDKEFLVACPKGEEEALRAAAHYLNERMRGIRDSGKVIGMERIAVMAALNITNELLRERGDDEGDAESTVQRIERLTAKLEAAIGDS